MGLLLKLLSISMLIVFLLAALVAGNLYWEFNFGSCKDGCGEGMAYFYFLPALVLAVITLLAAVGLHLLGVRVRSRGK